MKNLKNKLILGLISTGIVVGSSNLLAQESSRIRFSPWSKEVSGQPQATTSNHLAIAPHLYNQLQAIFNAGIQDAQNPRPDKVSHHLWPLTVSNPKIHTRQNNGQTEFLMGRWFNLSEKNRDEWGRLGKKTLTRRTWLTPVPQVQAFCHSCKGTGLPISGSTMLTLRLKQYLGLKLDTTENYFVELWVREKDLQRPCIDDEINDNSCDVLPPHIPATHSDLIQIRTDAVKNGYPWTGLGYTYDWGNPQTPHEGASEFVINATPETPVEVEIVAVTATQDYCKNKYLTP